MYTVEFYKDERNEWRWRVRHRNTKIIADGGEGYKRKNECRRALSRLAIALCDLQNMPTKEL